MKYFLVVFFVILILSGCSNQKEQSKSPSIEKSVKENKVESNIVRKGVINLSEIDENNDGRFYECPMDWNVVSDHSGNCPLCGMNLKEYTLAETEANLDKYGFKHK